MLRRNGAHTPARASASRTRASRSGDTTRNGRFARPCDRSTYTYMSSGRSPARLVSFSWVPLGFGPKQSRAWHPREFGAVLGVSASHTSSDRLRRLGLRPRVIPRSLRRRSRRLRGDTRRNASSAEYRLLVSCASVGASRELSSRRSPALAPHTCAVSPTFRCGAFFFAALALADVPSASLIIAAYPTRP